MEVREITPDDFTRVGHLLALLGPEGTDEQNVRRLTRLLSDESYTLWVLETGEDLIGLMLRRSGYWLNHDLKHDQLVATAIDPRYQGTEAMAMLNARGLESISSRDFSQVWALTGIDRPDMHDRLRRLGYSATEMKFMLPLGPPPESTLQAFKAKGKSVLRGLAGAVRALDQQTEASLEGESNGSWWTTEQVRDLMACASESEYYPLWKLALGCGLGTRELMSATWEQIDLRTATLTVPSRFRSTVGRVIPLAESTLEVLESVARKDRKGPIASQELEEVEQALADTCDKAGVPRLPLNGFSRTHGATLASAGVSLAEIAQRMGHKRVAFTAETYKDIIPPGTDLLATVNALL